MAPQTPTDFLSTGDIAGLLAFHAANHGSVRMESSTEENESENQTPPEGTEGTSNEGTEGEGAGDSNDKGDKPEGEELPPEVLRKKLTEANAEAAKYRTQLREAQDALAKAKTPEEFEAVQQEMTTKIADLEKSLLRSTVARKFELPDELAERLRGDTADEMEKDAKVLQALVATSAPESLGGGLDPSGDDDNEMDPRKLARRSRRR